MTDSATIDVPVRGTGRLANAAFASIPLVVGLACMWWLSSRIDTGSMGDVREVPMLRTAFVLSSLVYAVLAASLLVVFVGTWLYVRDILRMSQEVGRTTRLINIALLVLVALLLLVPLILIGEMLGYGGPVSDDFCSAHDLTKNFAFHDAVVFILFFGFVIVDILTIAGLEQAKSKLSIKDKKGKRGRELDISKAWARAQLLLIDIPVVFVASVLFCMVHMLEGSQILMRFGDAISMPPSSGIHVEAQTMTNLICNGAPLSDLQQFIGRTFIAGVAAGSLAVQVLMSQFIFMILSTNFRQPPGHEAK